MRKSHEERRREIIRSALDLATEQGVKQVSTQAIADRVGIAQATVFRHFKTRDEIFAGAIAWIADNMMAVLDGIIGKQLEPHAKLGAIIEQQLAFIARHRGLPRLLFSDRLHQESPMLKQAVREVMGRYMRRIAGIIRDGQAAGCFDRELDTEAAARHVTASIQGLLMRWSIFDFSFSLEEEARPLRDFLLAALRPGAFSNQD